MNYPDLKNPHIFQKLGRVDAKSVEACDQLLLILPSKPASSLFRQFPQGSKLQQVMKKSEPGSTPALTTRLANKKQTLIIGGTLEKVGILRYLVGAALNRVKSNGSLVATTVATCTATNLVTADQFIAITIPGSMYREEFSRRGHHLPFGEQIL